jgi:hypothetical protein
MKTRLNRGLFVAHDITMRTALVTGSDPWVQNSSVECFLDPECDGCRRLSCSFLRTQIATHLFQYHKNYISNCQFCLRLESNLQIEKFSFLEHNAVWSVESQPTFRRNISPQSSGSKNKPNKKPTRSKQQTEPDYVIRRYIKTDVSRHIPRITHTNSQS